MASQIHQGQIAGTRWDPRQYLMFSDHRLRPALELLDRVPIASPTMIFDLGCGSGEVTRIIAERWPSATVYGIDNSEEMLAQTAAEPSEIRWINSDIRELSARRYSVFLRRADLTMFWDCQVGSRKFTSFDQRPKQTYKRLSRRTKPAYRSLTGIDHR